MRDGGGSARGLDFSGGDGLPGHLLRHLVHSALESRSRAKARTAGEKGHAANVFFLRGNFLRVGECDKSSWRFAMYW